MLESKSTRRGVRICPTCQGRVGYRSKVCKHCWKSGSSARPTATAKHRNAKQQKNKANDRRKTRTVGAKARILLENTVAESSSSGSVEDYDMIITDLKSDESLIYVNVPTNSPDLETISNIDSELNGTANRSLSLENECQMDVMKSSNSDIVYKEQTHVEVNESEENGFDKEQNEMVMVPSVNYFGEVNKPTSELSQNQESSQGFTSCRSSSVSSLSAMPVGRDYEELSQNMGFGQGTNNLVDSLSDGSAITITNEKNNVRTYVDARDKSNNVGKNSVNDVGNLDTDASDKSTGDENIRKEEEIAVRETSESMNSEDQGLSNIVFKNVTCNSSALSTLASQNEDPNSPVLLVDGNSIDSVTNSQTLESKDYDVYMKTVTSEEGAVFDNTGVNPMPGVGSGGDSTGIVAEIKVRSEQRAGNEKKKRKFWQEFHDKRKKGRVSSVQFVRIEPKPFVQVGDSKKSDEGTVKQNR